jgi:hypothetical protein
MLRTVYAAALATMIIAASAQAQLLNGPKADDYPIIAQLVNDPARYVGRTVMIYGLVIERPSRFDFMIQDVSQLPLKIVGGRKSNVTAGDQLIVVGVFRDAPGGPYIAATSLIRAKVLGGGGCC